MEHFNMRQVTRLLLLTTAAALSAAGCTKTVTFDGKSPIDIAGTPPASVHKIISRVVLTDDQILIKDKVQFEINKATILPESYPLLTEVAEVMKEHPELKRVEVQGHASADGDHNANQTLSEARATSVMTYLTTNGGVEPGRLTEHGYGDTVPIADNNTEEGRVKNRRVEFHITERDTSKK
jgi:OOP family OmpA-OmpF porin